MGPYNGTSRTGVPKNGALRLRSYLGEESVSMYDPQFPNDGYDGTQHKYELGLFQVFGPKSGCLSEKSDSFPFLGKVVQTLPAVGFRYSVIKHKLNRMKNQFRSQSTKEWLRYRQFNSEGCKLRNMGKTYRRN